mmetsp:Transcript_32278/g.37247  ORF Transcript_32278/g.37247 Transcript_32278/m.37247 type:complete len:231 (-) Transcript_32278:391-1083(-)
MLLADQHVVNGVLQLRERHHRVLLHCGGQCRLVHDGGDLGGAHTWSTVCQQLCVVTIANTRNDRDLFQYDRFRSWRRLRRGLHCFSVFCFRTLLDGGDLRLAVGIPRHDTVQIKLKQIRTSGPIRHGNGNFSIESPFTQEGLVDSLGVVRRSDDDDGFFAGETVEFCEQLVDGTVFFATASTHGATAVTRANGVNFINENDARGRGTSLSKKLADTLRSTAAEDLNEVRP